MYYRILELMVSMSLATLLFVGAVSFYGFYGPGIVAGVETSAFGNPTAAGCVTLKGGLVKPHLMGLHFDSVVEDPELSGLMVKVIVYGLGDGRDGCREGTYKAMLIPIGNK